MVHLSCLVLQDYSFIPVQYISCTLYSCTVVLVLYFQYFTFLYSHVLFLYFIVHVLLYSFLYHDILFIT
ncbi:hypothetical protein M6B38_170075 [Iris pallida]|uniref:Uncharacterized protein n=1 Tax=Iris pallida TaxID=29817 RepID=A0AAX6ETL1_IRIPA|nr:hypothetical protein M6B38_170075 [Iris pallida]